MRARALKVTGAPFTAFAHRSSALACGRRSTQRKKRIGGERKKLEKRAEKKVTQRRRSEAKKGGEEGRPLGGGRVEGPSVREVGRARGCLCLGALACQWKGLLVAKKGGRWAEDEWRGLL